MFSNKSISILMSFLAACLISQAKTMKKDTVYKIGEYLIEASDKTKIDFIIKNKPDKKRISKGDTIYDSEKYLILGNDDKTSIYGIYKKYKSKFRFSQFPISIYKGKLAAPNFKTDTAAHTYHSQIRNQCKSEGVNFAGHYTLVLWGCGSDCQQVAIVDRINGKIYYSNIPGINSFIAYLFKCKPDSRMLILNSGLLEGHKGYVRCSPIVEVEIVEWVNNKARRLTE